MAAPLTTLTGTVAQAVTWSATYTDPVNGSVPNNIGRSNTLSFGTSATNVSNQIIVWRNTTTSSGTTIVDLSAAKTNVCGVATATMTSVYVAWLKLITAVDNASVGTACTSVTMGNTAATQQLLFFTNAASSVDLLGGANQGDCVMWCSTQANAKTISGSLKSWLITNNDAGHSAVTEICLVGNG